ncbi:MAG TPA: anti-sigma factor [Steroidobacteraceae bacterium]|nr:anti-sigma factor [Steroidobacteraceae bacterium]
MIDESMQEQAAAYALGALDENETKAFEVSLRVDPELRALVRELRSVTEALAGTAPALEPPAAVKARLLLEIDDRRPAGASRVQNVPIGAPAGSPGRAWIPWAVAAAMALVSLAFFWQSASLRSQLTAQAGRINELAASAELARAESADLRQTVAKLRESNRLASFRIALLDSLLAAAPRTIAVSVWDNERQDGVFIVRNLKPLPSDKDYQLWIIDPKYPSPVDAGVFQVDAKGNVKQDFRAKLPIQTANQFAVTIEQKGGAAVPNTKAMVLAGS